MLIPILGFAPDLDPTTKGVLTDCVAKIPTLKGMKAALSRVTVGLPALAAKCIGARVLQKLDGSYRFFAGSTTKLYEANGTSSWTDRTRVSSDYNASADIRWRYAQYGDVTLAVQKQDILQFITSGTNFANVGASVPKASVVETVGQFVFLLDTNEATYGDSTNRWWCSAIGDYADWTPAISTQCVTGTLTSSPGPILGGKRLGDSLVVYKERSMFLGTYQGPPAAWSFQEVSNTAGAQSQETIVPIVTKEGGAAHIFMGADNFYYFDGSRPVEIGTPIKNWFYARLNRDFAYLSEALKDDVNSLIYFFYPTTSSSTGVLDACVVYNYRANKWGMYDQTIETGVTYVSGGLTYASLEASYATYTALPNISYGSPFWFAGALSPAVFNTSHVLQSFTGDAGVSSMTTGDIGDDEMEILVHRVRPRYLQAPTGATLYNYHRQNLGESLSSDMTVTRSNGTFDFMRSARWHRLKIEDTGNSEIPALDVDVEKDGLE